MYAEERHTAIAERVLARGRMAVADLAQEFEVTTETIRRDLSVLERNGLLRRVHGGAVPVGGLVETMLAERDTENSDTKERIAKVAVEQLRSVDSTLLIDAGSSTAWLAGMLPRDRALTVFTHSVPIAYRLGVQPNVEVHMLPGKVRPATQAAVGAVTVAALSQLRVDLAFIGTNGLSAGHGLSTPDAEEAEAKRALIAAAGRTILLADSTKYDRDYTVRFANIGDVDTVVTDPQAPSHVVAELKRAGAEVLFA